MPLAPLADGLIAVDLAAPFLVLNAGQTDASGVLSTEQVTVKVTDGGGLTDTVDVTINVDDVNAFAAKYGLILREKYSDKDYLFQLTNHTGMNPIKLVVLLTEEDGSVAAAENDLNQQVSTYQFTQPVDTEYRRHWHLHAALSHADFDARASRVTVDRAGSRITVPSGCGNS